MADREKVIKGLKEIVIFFDIMSAIEGRCNELKQDAENAIDFLKEQEAEQVIHVYEEYPEHDWVRKENGDIDDFAYDGGYHNGPVCKRCYYSFCIFCNPDGWNDEPCIIDEYKCPKCGRCISKGTKFCSNCGQAVKWE